MRPQATIETQSHVPFEKLQLALGKDNGRYSIYKSKQDIPAQKKTLEKRVEITSGVYYCPMHCEGEKTYDKMRDCPVCGMDLVAEQSSHADPSLSWTCPMHAEIITEKPGDCPICGMDLVPFRSNISEEEKSYLLLLKKFWIALAFTIPIFIIAMSEMIPDNPLFNIMPQKYWNWFQLMGSLPVVFYAAWDVF